MEGQDGSRRARGHEGGREVRAERVRTVDDGTQAGGLRPGSREVLHRDVGVMSQGGEANQRTGAHRLGRTDRINHRRELAHRLNGHVDGRGAGQASGVGHRELVGQDKRRGTHRHVRRTDGRLCRGRRRRRHSRLSSADDLSPGVGQGETVGIHTCAAVQGHDGIGSRGSRVGRGHSGRSLRDQTENDHRGVRGRRGDAAAAHHQAEGEGLRGTGSHSRRREGRSRRGDTRDRHRLATNLGPLIGKASDRCARRAVQSDRCIREDGLSQPRVRDRGRSRDLRVDRDRDRGGVGDSGRAGHTEREVEGLGGRTEGHRRGGEGGDRGARAGQRDCGRRGPGERGERQAIGVKAAVAINGHRGTAVDRDIRAGNRRRLDKHRSHAAGDGQNAARPGRERAHDGVARDPTEGTGTTGEEGEGLEIVRRKRGARDVLGEEILRDRRLVLAVGEPVARRGRGSVREDGSAVVVDDRMNHPGRRQEDPGGGPAEDLVRGAETPAAGNGAGRRALIDVDAAPGAVGGSSGVAGDIHAEQIDGAARIGSETLEAGADGGFAETDGGHAANTKDRHIHRNVGRAGVGRRENAQAGDHGVGRDVGQVRVIGHRTGGRAGAVLHQGAGVAHVVAHPEGGFEVRIRLVGRKHAGSQGRITHRPLGQRSTRGDHERGRRRLDHVRVARQRTIGPGTERVVRIEHQRIGSAGQIRIGLHVGNAHRKARLTAHGRVLRIHREPAVGRVCAAITPRGVVQLDAGAGCGRVGEVAADTNFRVGVVDVGDVARA